MTDDEKAKAIIAAALRGATNVGANTTEDVAEHLVDVLAIEVMTETELDARLGTEVALQTRPINLQDLSLLEG